MNIALAQLNPTVGDIPGNARLVLQAVDAARAAGAALVVTPEMAVTGYPPEDLLLKADFVAANRRALDTIARAVRGISAVVGFVDRDAAGRLYNAAAIIQDGSIRAVYRKMALPNYGVFDEKRYFHPGSRPLTFRCGGDRVGVAICEDIWSDGGPLPSLARAGATVTVVLNASPYHAGKAREREALVSAQARRHRMPIAYVNMTGGQDELVFDGCSMIVDRRGRIAARAAAFAPALLVGTPAGGGRPVPLPPIEEEIYRALVTGTHDYVVKNGFHDVVIGLSGGIDSAIVAAIAVDALGAERVHGVFMPSRYSSAVSRQDAERLALNLGIDFLTLPIEPSVTAFTRTLAPVFAGLRADITEENLQARIRGTLLMALSNKFGWLVLTTGNKSEMSTGYATLYGDMAGGFAVIKDVPKTLVYRIARYRNRKGKVIPPRVLVKAPTAELRPGQKDSDSLPPYPALDPILKGYVEQDRPPGALRRTAGSSALAQRIARMVDRSEYKRRQAPPGVKITPKAFGRDRRMPITNRYTS